MEERVSGWSMCGSAIQEVVNTGEVVNEEHQATIRPRESVGQRAGRMNTVRDNAEHRITNDAILRKSVANASGVPVQSKLMVQQSYHPMNNPSLPPLPPPPLSSFPSFLSPPRLVPCSAPTTCPHWWTPGWASDTTRRRCHAWSTPPRCASGIRPISDRRWGR